MTSVFKRRPFYYDFQHDEVVEWFKRWETEYRRTNGSEQGFQLLRPLSIYELNDAMDDFAEFIRSQGTDKR